MFDIQGVRRRRDGNFRSIFDLIIVRKTANFFRERDRRCTKLFKVRFSYTTTEREIDLFHSDEIDVVRHR